MPIAATAPPAAASASRVTARVADQISSGSCSTQPPAGKCCVNSRCATVRIEPSASNTIARELVVP